ncbi:MAG: hypothetical protein WCV63_06410 [Negativicutes bacterium]|jgi:hypothetical protein
MKKSVNSSLVIFVIALCLLFMTGGAMAENFSFSGTIQHIDLEGSFWGIVATDGTHYEPTNLSDDYKHDGLAVQVVAVKKDLYNVHMWGKIIEIISISRIENNAHSNTPANSQR